MIRLNRHPVMAFVLAGYLAIPAGVASAQGNSAYRSADAVAGKAERLGVYGNVTKDCASGPLPTVRVVTPPKHGELNVRSGTLKVGRIPRCPKLAPKAQGVFYKANSGYTGADEISYEVRSASGKVESHTVSITVKGVAPADAKLTPDTDPDL
ncbi:4-aminobutyrate aminotransferase [Microvirga zambiensis]|uniref:4-aminobutyrate aminotransferase n=1 Tax=Microvirga zambiensis TaxID=1402137 RepID=UPI00191CE8CA|nr:4-aminobutyrate aminotransferase [Microvirga zambiensis]